MKTKFSKKKNEIVVRLTPHEASLLYSINEYTGRTSRRGHGQGGTVRELDAALALADLLRCYDSLA